MVDLLPDIEVVEGDEFNSHPTDTKLMGPDALERFRRGEQLPAVLVKTPLVCPRSSCLACMCLQRAKQTGRMLLPRPYNHIRLFFMRVSTGLLAKQSSFLHQLPQSQHAMDGQSSLEVRDVSGKQQKRR